MKTRPIWRHCGGVRLSTDPGGPVDPDVEPQPVDEVDRPAVFTLMAAGWYPPEQLITQAYGFCFTQRGRVVLVQHHDGSWGLPGGQVEPGERAEQALVREVAEEASARVIASRYLGCQHVWDPEAPAGPTSHYQSRWWARVELDRWRPNDEEVARRLVPPADVLTLLSWSRKEIAHKLLSLAVAVNDVTN